jgi:hypothetical protein
MERHLVLVDIQPLTPNLYTLYVIDNFSRLIIGSRIVPAKLGGGPPVVTTADALELVFGHYKRGLVLFEGAQRDLDRAHRRVSWRLRSPRLKKILSRTSNPGPRRTPAPRTT